MISLLRQFRRWLILAWAALCCTLLAQASETPLAWSLIEGPPLENGEIQNYLGFVNDSLIFSNQNGDSLFALHALSSDRPEWIRSSNTVLPQNIAASLTTEQGLLCVSKAESKDRPNLVSLIRIDLDSRHLVVTSLPSLPTPLQSPSAAFASGRLFVSGKLQGTNDAAVFALELGDGAGESAGWDRLPGWPQAPFDTITLGAQFDGYTDKLYIYLDQTPGNGAFFAFDIDSYYADRAATDAELGLPHWKRLSAQSPKLVDPFVFPVSQGHLYFASRASESRQAALWTYHTITDTWHSRGSLPGRALVDTFWSNNLLYSLEYANDSYHLHRALPAHTRSDFGTINYLAITLYMGGLIVIGFYFSRRNKNTNDFFRGGQRIPFWAAGLSIFATILSSITFIATPAKAYATNWSYLFFTFAVVVFAPFVAAYILPFFRRVNASSAYAYLEMRFNLWVRLFASASFILFHIGRMAIVMFLPSLALAAITDLSVEQCIVVIAALSIVYCAAGGLEAVIWTDVVQTFVLIGGAILSLIIIITQLEGGLGAFVSLGLEHEKFKLVNWEWGRASMAFDAFWVILLGSMGQNIISYSSDQAVIQRYMSVSSEKMARKAIYTNAIFMVPANILFFAIGTGLFLFYKQFPAKLDATIQTDGIFPFFMATELQVGIAGIVVAGVFAAAQSTISTSMNSTATTIVSDFCQRFNLLSSETAYLRLGRILTVAMGSLGMGMALLLATQDIRSLWDSFISVIGLFGGAMCGLFLLGMFTRRANATGSLAGAGVAVAILLYLIRETAVSGLLYGLIGVSITVVAGYALSALSPASKKSQAGLTIHDL